MQSKHSSSPLSGNEWRRRAVAAIRLFLRLAAPLACFDQRYEDQKRSVD